MSQPLPTGSRFFRAWGEAVVRFRWVVLLVIAALCALAVTQIRAKLKIDNSPEAFMSSGSEASRVLETFRDIFGRDDVFLLLIEGDVFTRPYLDKLAALHEELAAIDLELPSFGQRKAERDAWRGRPGAQGDAPTPEAPPEPVDDFDDFGDFGEGDDWADVEGGSVMDQVVSLLNVRKVRATEDAIDIGDLLDPMPTTPEELAAVRADVLGDPAKGLAPDRTLVGQVVGVQGRHSAILLRTHFLDQEDSVKVNDHVAGIVARYHGPGFEVHMAGVPTLTAALQRLMLGDMQRLVLVSLLVIGVVLMFMFVHPMGAVVPLMVVAVSGMWAVGLMASLGVPMTVITNILPAFLVCVGVADSVHLISVYRQARVEGLDGKRAAVEAVADTGVPIFFTTLTTALGLLSFQFASVDAIREMGVVGAFGVMCAFLGTVTLLPAMLSFNDKSVMGAGRNRRMAAVDGYLRLCAGLSGKSAAGRARTLVAAALLTATAFYGVSLLKVWHDPLSWMPEETPVRVAMDLADEQLGGTSTIQLLVEAQGAHGVKELALQQGLAGLDEELRAYVHPRVGTTIVSNVRSVVDVVRETHEALLGGDPANYHVPKTQDVLSHTFVLVESANPDDLRRLMSLDARTAQVTIGLKWLDAMSYAPLAEHVDATVARLFPPGVARVSMTGTVYNFLSTVAMLITDLLRSFGIAFAAITLIMVVLLRSVKLGLIAMVPNLLPIAYILGLMGFASIPIDMANLMIASIALGIAVDDTIHFLHHFRVHYDQTGDTEAAIRHSLRHTGRALVVTSVILSCGFFVYLTSSMLSLQRFGALIGLTVIFAVTLDLVLAPALLRVFYRTRHVP